jgi:predicted CXXCH cytochrome family protein
MTRTAKIALCATAAVVALAMPAVGREGLPGYGGVKLCSACHKSTNADIVAAQPKTPHASAFWAVADQGEQQKIVGDFASASGFKQTDVAYVLGAGARAQAYIGSDFKVLPGEWNVHGKNWVAIPADDAKKNCIACHTTGYDVASGQWSDAGVTCEACHGPGANHARSSDKKATIVNPKNLPPDRQAMICGHCHSRGKNPDGLPFAVGYVPGDDLNKFVKLDTAWDQGARNSQYNDLVTGKHFQHNITCMTCHDPHGVTTQPHQLLKSPDETCTQCHAADTLTGAQHSSAKDCVRCHMINGSHQFEKPQVVPAS